MQLVQIEKREEGFPSNFLNPQPYLEALPSFAPSLPRGAREFAEEGGHYDFSSSRCIKDLALGSLVMRESGSGQLSLMISLIGNEWKHDADLIIEYRNLLKCSIGVGALEIGREVWPDSRRLGDVQLDETLPVPNGCSHEIQFTGGSIFIESEDFTASWVAK